jgi:hypothetical protein
MWLMPTEDYTNLKTRSVNPNEVRQQRRYLKRRVSTIFHKLKEFLVKSRDGIVSYDSLSEYQRTEEIISHGSNQTSNHLSIDGTAPTMTLPDPNEREPDEDPVPTSQLSTGSTQTPVQSQGDDRTQDNSVTQQTHQMVQQDVQPTQSGEIFFLYLITGILGVGIKAGRSHIDPDNVPLNNNEQITDQAAIKRRKAEIAVLRRYKTSYGTKINIHVYIVNDCLAAREKCFHLYVSDRLHI